MTQAPDTSWYDAYAQEASALPVAGSAEEARPGEWRNVWVWIGRARDEIFPAGLEILGKARQIADELGVRVCAVVFGHGVASAPRILGEHGADRVYLADDPAFAEFQIDVVREALLALVTKRRPEILLMPATIQGRNLAAQLAARLDTGIVPNCEDLSIEAGERLLIQTQPSYENRLVTVLATPERRPQIATVRPGSFRRPAPDPSRSVQTVDVTKEVPRAEPGTQTLEAAPPLESPLSQRDAVLAGGLGLGSKKAFERLEHLGRLLDAAVVGTRAAVTCGWTTRDRLLTVAEQRIHPRLYLGFGVVGEYDHLKSIEQAETVIAVTEDPEAPICQVADFIALGPPDELLDEMIRRVEEAQRNRLLVPKPAPKRGRP